MSILSGCKGNDGEDGDIKVTLMATKAFQKQSFAAGCFVVSSEEAYCLCYENGTEYTGDADGSSKCHYIVGSASLVTNYTDVSNLYEGQHSYCWTTDSSTLSTLCTTEDSSINYIYLEQERGEEAEYNLVPVDGEDGEDTDIRIMYTTDGPNITYF